jgi:hypothetical protein
LFEGRVVAQNLDLEAAMLVVRLIVFAPKYELEKQVAVLDLVHIVAAWLPILVALYEAGEAIQCAQGSVERQTVSQDSLEKQVVVQILGPEFAILGVKLAGFQDPSQTILVAQVLYQKTEALG